MLSRLVCQNKKEFGTFEKAFKYEKEDQFILNYFFENDKNFMSFVKVFLSSNHTLATLWN